MLVIKNIPIFITSLLIVSVFNSCSKKQAAQRGEVGNFYYLTGPQKHEVIATMNESDLALERDSLYRLLDAGETYIPTDLDSTILIVQIYDKDQFTEINTNRFSKPEGRALERSYRIYDRKKDKLMNRYPYTMIYAHSDSIEDFSVDTHKYILKTAERLVPYDESKLQVRSDGLVTGWEAYTIYYLYDRKEKKHFKQLHTHKLLYKEP